MQALRCCYDITKCKENFEQIAPLQNWIICWKNERIYATRSTCTLWFTFNKLRILCILSACCVLCISIYILLRRAQNKYTYTVWAPLPWTLIWTDPNTRQLFNYICLRERINMFICINRRIRMYKRTNKIRYLI